MIIIGWNGYADCPNLIIQGPVREKDNTNLFISDA